MHSCYHARMKTISLTEDAYQRLADLKASPKDSFSKVVLRAIPKRGTAARMLDAVADLPELTEAQAKRMEKLAAENNDWNNWRDAWTTS